MFIWLLLPVVMVLTWGTPLSAGVIAVHPTTSVDDAVGISYRFRVAEQSGSQYGKILFLAHSLYNPQNCSGAHCPQHQIETIISNSTHAPQVGDCCWDGIGTAPQPPVCANYNAAPFSGLKIGAWIGEKTAPAGLWMSDSALWPRRALGIDLSLTDFKIESIYQRDITGLDGQITWRRGEILPADDPRSWGRACLPMALSRQMRQWHVDVDLGGEGWNGTVIYPDDEVTYLIPDRIMEFVTEFFEFPGTVRIFVWDIMAISEQRGAIPLSSWQIVYRHPGVPVGFWGLRRATYRGAPVLEFGTDPRFTYVSDPWTIITIPAPTSIPTLDYRGLMVLMALFIVMVALSLSTRRFLFSAP